MSSSSSAPASTQSAGDSQATQTPPGGNTSSNLYLVTFLATLFLLLFVSCAIVLRSFILRRRYQRRLEEALAAGIILAPRSQGSRRKRFGAKPKLFDAYLSDGGEKWEDIMPLAAQPITSKRRYKDKNCGANQLPSTPPPAATRSSQQPATPPSHPTSGPQQSRSLANLPVFRSLGRLRSRWGVDEDEIIVINDPAIADPPVKPTHVRVELLQVSVLIAMPSPTRSQKRKLASSSDVAGLNGKERALEDTYEEEEGIPEVAIGVTKCSGWKHQQSPQQLNIEQDSSTKRPDFVGV